MKVKIKSLGPCCGPLALFISLLLGAAFSARADCAPLPQGIVAWWAAEGDATDQIGTHNGSLHGNTTYGPGEVGEAFSFDGNSGGVLVSDAPDLRFTNAMTIEAWVFPNAYSTGFPCEIVSKWYGNGSQMSFSTSIDTSGLAYIIVSSDGTTTDFGGNYTTLYTVDTVPLNQWSHFAVSYDGATLRIYLNGVLENQTDWSQGLFPGTAPLVIGATTVASVFNGLIDEVALYNRALSDSEIQGIFEAGSAGKCGESPFIITQPQGQTVTAGATVNFTASAAGAPPLYYQWLFNSAAIVGATNTVLGLTNVQLDQAGSYSLLVSNAYGSTNSLDAILTVNPLPPCVPPPSGLISWWNAESNAWDQAGTNDGTLQGGAAFASGLVGQAFNFAGNGSVFVPDSPSLHITNALTVEAWIFPRSEGGNPREIVSKWFGNGNQNSFTTSIDHTGHAYILISRNGSSSMAGIDHVEVFSTGTVPINQWTHFAATYDGATVSIYLNGILDTTAPWTNAIFAGTAPLYIGAAQTLSEFDGLIDEPSVYNRALSVSEIQSIYGAAPAGKCPLPPAILSGPRSQTVRLGSNVVFTVAAGGARPLRYQWKFNNANVPGATNAFLTLGGVQPTNSGTYSVSVTNALNSVTSTGAVLKVNVVLAFANGLLLTNSQNSYGGPVTVQLQNLYTNGLVFYTLDGTTPTFASSQYSGPFIVSNNVVLRTLGYSPDFFQSVVSDPAAILIVPSFSLAVTTNGGGTVALSPTNGTYLSNSVVTATAKAASGWTFFQWLGDASGTNPVTTVTMGGNRSIQAVFGTTLGTTAAGNGSVSLNPPGGVYPYGTVVAVIATPQSGNYFAIWGGAGNGASSNPLYFTVTNANQTVSALFQPLSGGQVALAVVPSGRGKVAVSPAANAYAFGAGVTITAMPDAKQTFLGWSGDATGTSNPLSVTMNQSRVITANFTHNAVLTPLTPPSALPGNGFQFAMDGDFSGVYSLESSTGLVNWLPLATLTNFYGRLQFTDPQATNAPRMFYRAVQIQ